MRDLLRRTCLLLGAVVVLFSWLPHANAIENEAFGITPFPERVHNADRTSYSIPLEKGATYEDAVRIYNRTDEILDLAIYATDAQAALDNTISVGLREDHPKGVGTWIDISLASIELQPRDAKTIAFRVKVRSSDPSPKLGAIVVENINRGLAKNAAQRLHLLVQTVPPNTPTSSKHVRTFIAQSPWIAVALLGLVVAGLLVWVGARRARRRPRDLVVEPGGLDAIDEEEAIAASRPVIRRFGASASEGPTSSRSVLDRMRASASARRRDERPLLDDALLVEIDDPDEDVAEAAHERTTTRAAPAPRPQADHEPERRPPKRTAPKPKPATRSAARSQTRSTAQPKAKPKAKRKPAPLRPKPKARSTNRSASSARTRRPERAVKPKPQRTAKPKPKAKAVAKTDKNFIPLKDL